jgi:hypothetical protein
MVDRRHEVLNYFVKAQKASEPQDIFSTPLAHDGDEGEVFWMSNSTESCVSLTEFTAVPQGASPDPRKKVRGSSLHIPDEVRPD